MRYLLNVAYLSLLTLLIPWWVYAVVVRGKYRSGYRQKLGGLVPRRTGNRPCIWMHAVSVGEVNLLQPLVERLPQVLPGWDCCISTTTQTGYELATARFPDQSVFYCPLDFSWSVTTAIRRIRPDVLLLAELELWPNLIAAAGRSGASVVVANGRLGESSARGYRRIRWFARRLLRSVDLIAVQNEDYAQRFLDLGAEPDSVAVTGSIKFDGAETDRNNRRTQALARLAGIAETDAVFLAGSTQAPEEALALQAFQNLSARYPQLRLILIPRHPSRFDEVARMLDDEGVAWRRRSLLPPPTDATKVAAAGEATADRILLVDTVGELGAWWGTCQIAFVGGSMGTRGGQNMIEPAAYGAAVSFGPQTRNFRDVVRLLRSAKAAVVVEDGRQMEEFVERCLRDPAWASQLGGRAQELVRRQLGATERTLALLVRLLENRPTAVREEAASVAAEPGDRHGRGSLADSPLQPPAESGVPTDAKKSA